MIKAISILVIILSSLPALAAPKPHWYNSKRFWLGTAIIAGSVVADVETTQAAIGRGAQEANPLYGSHPSRLRAYSIGFALSAPAIGGLAVGESEPHPWRWWTLFTVIGSGPHIGAAAYNAGVQ